MKKITLKKGLNYFVSASFFLLAIYCCMYYIWSDFFIMETNTDVLDNVIWAQATAESGKLINPDYVYPYFIPLGGHLLMVPFIKIFGLGILAARAGMTIFTLVMAISMILFFKTFLEKWNLSFLATGAMLLSMLSTEKIREIFFGHVLHYSLAIVLWMLAVVFIDYFDKYKNVNETKTKVIIGIMTIHFFICGLEGMTVMLFSAVPWIGYVAFTYFISEKKIKEYSTWDKRAIGFSVLGLLVGFVTFKLLTKGIVNTYEKQYLEYDLYSNWVDNIFETVYQWIYLWIDIFSYNNVYVEILSLNGILYLVKIIMMLMTTILSIGTVFFYGKTEKEIERKIMVSHWVILAATIYLYVFGKVAIHSWRMLPLWFSSIIVTLIILRNILQNTSKEKLFRKLFKFAVVGILVILCNSLLCGMQVLKRNLDTNNVWFGDNTMIDILRENNLTEGYVLDYWMGNSITVLTNEEIKVRCVNLSAEAELIYERCQNNINWYNNENEQERVFVIVPDYMLEYYFGYFGISEEQFQTNVVERAIEVYEGSQFYYREKAMVDFTVYVLPGEEITVLEGISGQ